jgi:hypothetical protein
MTSPIFKIGDTIKIVSRLRKEDGTYLDISQKTIRSVLKRNEVEAVGVVQLLDATTIRTVFDTSEMLSGKYQTDIRLTESDDSFSTPTIVIDLQPKVS